MNLRNRLPFYISLIQQGLEWFGYPLICTKAKAKPLKNYKVYGNTVQGGLPDGYTRLESLSSTGYEYINTGLVMRSGDEIELDYEWLGNTPSGLSSDMMFFGCQNIDTTRGGLWIELYKRESGLPTWYARFGGTGSNSATASAEHTTGRHLLNINRERLAIDGSQVIVLTTSADTFQTTPLTLFGRLSATGTQLNSAKLKVYGFKVINNGVVRLNLIPCKNADNVLGMYDTVTEQFLVNSGTGEFIAGEVIQPTPTTPIAIESVGVYDSATGKYKIPVNVNGTITSIYLSEPLRKIGDYADYIDYENQKVVRNVKELVLNGSEKWSVSAESYGVSYLFTPTGLDAKMIRNIPIATHFKTSSATGSVNIPNNGIGGSANSNSWIGIRMDGQTLDSFKSWLSINLPIINYVLTTPTEESITLPQITLPGEVTITTETTVKPSDMYGKQ